MVALAIASSITSQVNTLLEAVRHFRSVVIDAGSRVTTAHAHQCCIFQSYAKTVPSRMKLTMREPASMTTDMWSRHVTFYSNSVYREKAERSVCCCPKPLYLKTDFSHLHCTCTCTCTTIDKKLCLWMFCMAFIFIFFTWGGTMGVDFILFASMLQAIKPQKLLL